MPYTDWTSLAHTTQDYIPVANVVGAATSANPTFTGNGSITGNADAVQWLVKGNATQTANILEVRNSANTLLCSVTNAGLVAAVSLQASGLTAGRVPLVGTGGLLGDNANFTYTVGTGLKVNDATASTSSTTGAMVVTGGVGIGGAIYAGGQGRFGGVVHIDGAGGSFAANRLFIQNEGGSVSAYYSCGADTSTYGVHTFWASTSNGTSVAVMRVYFDHYSIPLTTASTSATTGALVVTGGAGIGGNLNIAGYFVSAQQIVCSSYIQATNIFVVNGAAGTSRSFDFRTSNSTRWTLSVNGTAESGSNAGSDIVLNSLTDAGAAIDSPLYIVRASGGAITIGGTTLRPSTFTGSIKSTNPTAGIGYGTGAGGTVTQITSKATGVTLNTICGTITLNNASLAADTGVAFVFTNSAIAATDVVFIQHDSGGTLGAYGFGVTPAAGSATITVHNNTPGALAEAIVLRFVVIKAVTA